MSENDFKSPSYFEGESEHSHQVALFAAIAMYAGGESQGGELRRIAESLKMNALFWREDQTYGYADAQSMFDEGERLERCAVALRWIHAVPNGGSRGEEGGGRIASIRGGQMKAEGVKRGISDIDVPVARHGYHGFKIEMKAPGKIKTIERGERKGQIETGESKEQIAYGKFLADEGYLYSVFDSWRDAFKAIMWYLGFEHTLGWEL